jgi:hypothetical protein
MAGIRDDLERQGVTHLLVGYSLFPWTAARAGGASVVTSDILVKSRPGYYLQLRNEATLDLFVREYGERVYSDPARYVLYRLR